LICVFGKNTFSTAGVVDVMYVVCNVIAITIISVDEKIKFEIGKNVMIISSSGVIFVKYLAISIFN
jgi:ribosomal protein L11 methylase PrmA